MRGWWTITARALSLVFALALVVPSAIHSAEAHHSAGRELSLATTTDVAAADHSDACPACHANCGCHQALNLDETPAMPARGSGSASYAVAVTEAGSVSPDRLPRPPRA
ncbi:hypothetical protein G3T14_19655 [Methylobacterium sp. BTF04]|nr:hypothetical protein [Methylobacterium sp. BTF04]